MYFEATLCCSIITQFQYFLTLDTIQHYSTPLDTVYISDFIRSLPIGGEFEEAVDMHGKARGHRQRKEAESLTLERRGWLRIAAHVRRHLDQQKNRKIVVI